ncbi:type 2 DNA topoisomerase 6 subunit B-like [Echeneis naucrates]|uniref:type 2 DNA topoisomerase 6 subunit B-like n=1 Tax=Echeneis naucrates TaxID=173247 RepID=UPI00111399D4|nr:type 2 DNA topoisomerase 6 subunit B-like [Echeneis naucrates]
MLREIQQVLRLLLLLGKRRQRRCLKGEGGLFVLLWSRTGKRLHCTVAAAGPWCRGINMKALQPVLADLKESMFPCVWSCPESDPVDLWTFTDLYGSLRLLLSFELKDARLFTPEWQTHIETFLHIFSLANAGVKIHLKFRLNQMTNQQDFRVKIKSKVPQADNPSLVLDVTCKTRPPECVTKGCWCQGGHPVCGSKLPLNIPPQAMDQGLYGELSILPVTLLRPCVLQYPNLATRLTHIQVLVYSPSNVPVSAPSSFFQSLFAHLGCQELNQCDLHCFTFKDHALSSSTVYEAEQEIWEEESSPSTIQQSLLLFLFLQHSDPFTSQAFDVLVTEALIEHHLEDIMSNNRQAIRTALQTELMNALGAQHQRKKEQEKLCSALDVILSSSMSIVSCSCNVDFRKACLNSMMVGDTRELSASLSESLRRVTSWKFRSRSGCYSAQMEEHPEVDEFTRPEI